MMFYSTPSIGPVPGVQAPCVLCGIGANCIDHWMRYCMVTHIVLLLPFRERAIAGLHQLAESNQHGLALATLTLFHLRKTIHEKGGLSEHPTEHHLPNDAARLRTIAEHIAGAVVTSLATETILYFDIQFQPHPIIGCTRLIQVKLSPLHIAGQLHPAMAITALTDIPQGTTVIVADEGDARYSLLHQHHKAPHITPNVCYDYHHCKCGCIHIEVKATRAVAEGEPLLYDEHMPGAQRTCTVRWILQT